MISSTTIATFSDVHRADVIDLTRRSLLAEDAPDAALIVEIFTRHGGGVVALNGATVIGVALASPGIKDAAIAHLDLLVVDPAHRRQGVARTLLAELEPRLKAQGHSSVRVRGNAPDYAWPGVDVRQTAGICTLTALGYTHNQTAWNMTADLIPGSPALAETATAESRLAAQGVEVRLARPEDLAMLSPVVDAEWGPSWVAEVERAVNGDGGCHLGLRDGAPIAFAAWGGCRPGWFGPMGTLPAAKGLGIGSVLLRRCLADQAALGLSSAQIGWVGPVPFYSTAAAARIERVFFTFTKDL
jgi:mycothiol synthase